MGAVPPVPGRGCSRSARPFLFWTTKCSGNGLFKPFPALMSLWGPVEPVDPPRCVPGAGEIAGDAAWLKEHLGARWVTGMLCVAADHPPEKVQTVWVIDADRVCMDHSAARCSGLPAMARECLASARLPATPH